MNDFTASNGMQIRTRPAIDDSFGIYNTAGKSTLANSYDHLNDREMQTLREFFQAEADERLGRWRWPENPDYVVYLNDGYAVVVSESDPSRRPDRVHRRYLEDPEGSLGWGEFAARAYFDAHPEPKPWHDAKAGEGWVIEIGEGDHENFQAVVVSNDGKFLHRDGGSTDVTSFWIRSGRRFHPEVSA